LFGLLLGALILGGVFLFTKKPNHMFLSQAVSSFAMIEGFRQMSCPMSSYIWLYFGLISGAMVLMGVVQIAFDKRVQDLRIVYLLDTQKIKAFTHKRQIYLSVGLVELLEPEEIRAVCAHELYHVMHTPNRYLANTLAVASLWMKSYRDDAKADRFAAEVAGRENLISAFNKLRILNRKKRISRIAA
jgi:Zn-dependent protease with chaperone function